MLLAPLRQRLDILKRVLVPDVREVLCVRSPQYGDDPLDLVEVVLPREQRGTTQKLGEDAPTGPDVEGLVVLAGVEDDLRGAVPARDDVLGLELGLEFIAPRESEVAYFKIAVLVQQ